MEDLLYEVESVRRFVGLRLTEALPDETTILNFRHLLEKHGLGEGLFEEINAHLASRGHRLRTGTIVDASIIDAPSSTKNRRRARGMKAHIYRLTRRERKKLPPETHNPCAADCGEGGAAGSFPGKEQAAHRVHASIMRAGRLM